MPASVTPRRFPRPWSIDETDACFIVRDASRQARSPVSVSRWSRVRSKVEICVLRHIPPSRFVFEKT